MYAVISMVAIISLFVNIQCFNDLKNTDSIAEIVRRVNSRDSGADEIDQFELCQVRCRLRKHKDCNQNTLDCNDECLNGFEINSQGICQLSLQTEPENKEFMPTEELDKVWSINDKKSVKENENPAASSVGDDETKEKEEVKVDKKSDDKEVLEQDVDKSSSDAYSLADPVVTVKFYDAKWMFYIVLSGCISAALFGITITGICWYRLQRNMKATSDADYPSYGVSGATKNAPPTADEINAMAGSPTSGGATADRKLAQSAQMYHYQHQKQQMLNVEKAQSNFNKNQSDSEDENEDGDYTVYECPGLAPTGEMEVNNPLFGGHIEAEKDIEATTGEAKSSSKSPEHSK